MMAAELSVHGRLMDDADLLPLESYWIWIVVTVLIDVFRHPSRDCSDYGRDTRPSVGHLGGQRTNAGTPGSTAARRRDTIGGEPTEGEGKMTETAVPTTRPPRRSTRGSPTSRGAERGRRRGRGRAVRGRRASGATSSRSPGTSRPSRARRASGDMLDADARRTCGRAASHTTERADRGRRRHRRRGSRSRPRSGRGIGHLRLRDGKAWTLLTTLYELKGHEEPHGPGPARWASSTAPTASRETWLERARAGGRRARLRRRSPTW